MRRRTTLYVFAAFVVLSFVSCSDRSFTKPLEVPSTPVFPAAVGWALIDSLYAQVYDVPQADGVVLGYYRRSAIVRIIERRIQSTENGPVFWLRNDGEEPGWLRQSDVRLFDSAEQAETAKSMVLP